MPDGLGRDQEVLALGDHETEHPEAQEDRDAEREQLAPGRGQAGQRDAEQQAHQETEEQPDDGGDELGGRERLDAGGCSHWAGTTVRYGRIAKPTTTHAMTQAAR